jgi:hypothetical protein
MKPLATPVVGGMLSSLICASLIRLQGSTFLRDHKRLALASAPVWRNGRRTGLKNVKMAFFGRIFWPLLTRAFASVYKPKFTFCLSLPC